MARPKKDLFALSRVEEMYRELLVIQSDSDLALEYQQAVESRDLRALMIVGQELARRLLDGAPQKAAGGALGKTA
jgi:hypothetical protein